MSNAKFKQLLTLPKKDFIIKRKNYHLAIDYQYRKLEANLAHLEEERKLSIDFGIQSCEYERWVNHTIAMSFSMRLDDMEAKVAAVRHLVRMIVRKHDKKENIKVLSISLDAEIMENFYEIHIFPELK